jgi:hypothetical protein
MMIRYFDAVDRKALSELSVHHRLGVWRFSGLRKGKGEVLGVEQDADIRKRGAAIPRTTR